MTAPAPLDLTAVEVLNRDPALRGRLVQTSTGCWEWQGYRLRQYGQLRVKEDGSWRTRLAHRYAWAQINGPIPDGKSVCHRCDNPPCCNPAHLFLGTHADNMRDMHRKGRARNGSEQRTDCAAGHPLSGDNLMTIKRRDGRTRRICRECDRIRCRQQRRSA